MSRLYVTSTPVGNLEDITLRAITVLKGVSRILAEDTRRTAILLRRYDIETPLISAHEHNEAARSGQLVAWLDAGEDVALVSDAGTPLLSDPGARLVRAVIDAGHEVVPVPGASALLAALVAAGLPAEPFTFHGFPPRSGSARRELLETLSTLPHTSVLYESPARLAALLEDLVTACGGERPVAVARELTKLHESVVRGTLTEVLSYYQDGAVRGEVVVVLGGAPPPAPASAEDAADLARELLDAGATPRSAAKELAQRLHISRNEAYSLVLSLGGGGREKE
ncbi:MAG TPA: 16S rRNA (cytidine(1402)-2'-O)-methyltransferase [Longimicrobiales bacterium]|nr:16S rRNA (cytidine(1402)-2'-O)-methyltransferase [Longimicrobiales bacterium]